MLVCAGFFFLMVGVALAVFSFTMEDEGVRGLWFIFLAFPLAGLVILARGIHMVLNSSAAQHCSNPEYV